MNGAQSAGRRQPGVRETAPAQKDNHQPNQLIGARLGFVGLVTYSDSQGKGHQNIAFFIDGKVYLDKGGERWMQENLREAAPWLADQLHVAYQRQVPKLLAQAGALAEGAEEEPEVPAQEVDVVPPPAAPPQPGAEKSTQKRLTQALGAGGQG